MNYPKVAATVGLVATLALALPDVASAQKKGGGGGGGRAVPRGSVRGGGSQRSGSYRGPVVRVGPGRGYYGRGYYRSYTPSFNLRFFYGYPGYYGGYGYGWPYSYNNYFYGSFGSPYYGYGGYYSPYGYGYSGYSGRPYGGVRIDVPERDAEVFVDGYFVGSVDDFDGRLQQANLESGPHHIEIQKEGFESISFDVNVEPGRTITYRGNMRQEP